jgi:hypothetical protein
MRTKAMSAAGKRKVIVNRYREKAAKLKSGPSSEDIWVPRFSQKIHREKFRSLVTRRSFIKPFY